MTLFNPWPDQPRVIPRGREASWRPDERPVPAARPELGCGNRHQRLHAARFVRASAERLAGSVGHYTFISSLSVYRDFSAPVDEASAVETLDDPTVEEVTGGTYGGLKALCEEAVLGTLPGQCLVVRGWPDRRAVRSAEPLPLLAQAGPAGRPCAGARRSRALG